MNAAIAQALSFQKSTRPVDPTLDPIFECRIRTYQAMIDAKITENSAQCEAKIP